MEEVEIFARGIVYKITGNDGTYYYGSTKRSLERRLAEHLTTCDNVHVPATRHFQKLGREKVSAEIISEHFNITKRELREQEDVMIQQHLGKPGCLNEQGAIQDYERTRINENIAKMKRYYENHEEHLACQKMTRDKRTEEQKLEVRKSWNKYSETHREIKRARGAKPLHCSLCDWTGRYDGRARHKLHKSHVKALEKIPAELREQAEKEAFSVVEKAVVECPEEADAQM